MDISRDVRGKFSAFIGDQEIARLLDQEIEGEVLFDKFSRGRYSTDASIYQIEPLGVVVPKTENDISVTFEVAKKYGLPVLPRGGGSSQCGQTVGESIVIDTSKYLNKILDFDLNNKMVWVEPGIVLDSLNSFLKPHNLWFPVDVSTSSRATIGGMAGIIVAVLVRFVTVLCAIMFDPLKQFWQMAGQCVLDQLLRMNPLEE